MRADATLGFVVQQAAAIFTLASHTQWKQNKIARKMMMMMTARVNFIIVPHLNHATNVDLWHVHYIAWPLNFASRRHKGARMAIVMNPVQILFEKSNFKGSRNGRIAMDYAFSNRFQQKMSMIYLKNI